MNSNGKTKEKRLSCGAERVIIPAATFIINIVPATGIIINAAAINILPAALIPAPIRIAGEGIAPIGKIEKLSKNTRITIK